MHCANAVHSLNYNNEKRNIEKNGTSTQRNTHRAAHTVGVQPHIKPTVSAPSDRAAHTVGVQPHIKPTVSAPSDKWWGGEGCELP